MDSVQPRPVVPVSVRHLKSLPRDELLQFVQENVRNLLEDEAAAVLENPYVTAPICQMIARTQRLTAFYSVRVRLVAHKQTPQAHAVKLVHYLYWTDLVRLSVDVKVPAPVRRAIDNLLANKIDKLTLGERITSAKRCSPALIKLLLFDPDPKVFEALLINQRLREDDLLLLASGERATSAKLQLLADDRKWSYRYSIRKALVMNPRTPRATAASLLRFLSRRDLRMIHSNPQTTVYLRRCIERLQPSEFPA
ncbi:MAG TPA: hypothetical protein VKH35_04080 [Thermoanaerobaculia bacterium]|nr:hypothetical protein [Thermoanaerobaculia bacterium]